MDRTRLAGYVFGVLTAVCWATSPILIRKGLVGLPSSLWGVTVGLVVATSVYLTWFALRRPVAGPWCRGWRQLPGPIKIAIGFQALAGIASGLGTVGRTVSIELAPIVVVLPLGQTTALFTLLFSLLFLGQSVEQITWRLAVGAVFVVTGSALVIIGQNL